MNFLTISEKGILIMSNLNLLKEEFSSDELKYIYNRYCDWSSSSSNQSLVHEFLCDAEEYGMHKDDLKDWFGMFCKGERSSNASKDLKDWFEKLCKGERGSNDLKDWFGKLCKGERSSDELFEEFKTLVTNSPSVFRQLDYHLCFHLLLGSSDNLFRERTIPLCSSDKVVFEMNKSAAMSESKVLRDITDWFLDDQEHEIPLQVPSLFLSNTISFCKKNHKFNRMIGTNLKQLKIVLNRLEGTVNDYMGWINGFVKSNKPLFSHLHQAADYLDIPALLELTSMAIGDMKESSVEDISEWYAGLSIPQMLSPLGIEAFSTLSQLDFFS